MPRPTPPFLSSDHETITALLSRCQALEDELARLRARFTKLDLPRYSGAPMLDSVLKNENPAFRAWASSLPPEYWARYDLSAVRIGYEGAKGALKLEEGV